MDFNRFVEYHKWLDDRCRHVGEYFSHKYPPLKQYIYIRWSIDDDDVPSTLDSSGCYIREKLNEEIILIFEFIFDKETTTEIIIPGRILEGDDIALYVVSIIEEDKRKQEEYEKQQREIKEAKKLEYEAQQELRDRKEYNRLKRKYEKKS